MKSYWCEALFHKDGDIIEGMVAKDGLLIKLNPKDGMGLTKSFPRKKQVWYFNDTYDREIAKYDMWADEIIANPQLAWQNGYEIIT